MPKRSSKPPDDPNEGAHDAVKRLTGNDEETVTDPDDEARRAAARLLGRLGGKKGGPARKKALSAERRTEIAKKAAQTRWKDHKTGD